MDDMSGVWVVVGMLIGGALTYLGLWLGAKIKKEKK